MKEPVQKFKKGAKVISNAKETYGWEGEVTDVKIGASHLTPHIKFYEYEICFFKSDSFVPTKYWVSDLDLEPLEIKR